MHNPKNILFAAIVWLGISCQQTEPVEAPSNTPKSKTETNSADIFSAKESEILIPPVSAANPKQPESQPQNPEPTPIENSPSPSSASSTPHPNVPFKKLDCYLDPQDKPEFCDIEKEIHLQTNAIRSSLNLTAFQYNPMISYAARRWSQSMFNAGRISHDGFLEGKRLDTFLLKFPGQGYVAFKHENVAASNNVNLSMPAAQIARVFVTMWRNSPAHYQAMVATDSKEHGAGIYTEGINSFAASQHMGEHYPNVVIRPH